MTDASVPLTARGRRTRAALVEAAAAVFAEQRYLETSVSDIADRANVAHGTFYRYFESKDQIFREVATDLQQRMIKTRVDDERPPRCATIQEETLWRIGRANLIFLRAYRDNAALLATIEQVVTFSDELRQIRREARMAFIDRAERAIERLQERGLACRDVDPHYAAHALGAMVDRFAYVTFVLGDTFELDEAARTLSLLWARSLGLDIPEGQPLRRPTS
ncbi:MAG: TetR/AcrR family transcriptional regulator [Desertimonas sp.]